MKPFTDPFARAAKASGQGFGKVSKVLGLETNPYLAYYRKLKPNDFSTILQTYGPDATVEYIREMESRNLTGR